jgi:hypothetical protein
MIENHVKRINIENSKVSAFFFAFGIFSKVDIEKAFELQVHVFILEIPYTSVKDPYEFLKSIAQPLRKK